MPTAGPAPDHPGPPGTTNKVTGTWGCSRRGDVCAAGAGSGPIVRGRALPILCSPFRATISIPAPEPPFTARKTHGAEMLLASRALQPSIACRSPRHEGGVGKVQSDGKYGASLGTRNGSAPLIILAGPTLPSERTTPPNYFEAALTQQIFPTRCKTFHYTRPRRRRPITHRYE